MRRRPRQTGSEALAGCWRRWTAVVELFARRLPGRRRVDPASYAALYREVLAACRSRADSAPEGERAYYAGLEELARPWLSPRTLAQADREILDSLLARCREVDRKLGGRRRPSGAFARALRPLLMASAPAGALAALLWVAGVGPDRALDHLRGWSDVAWLTVKRSSDLQRLAAVAAVVVVVSVVAVSRTARS